MKFLAAALTIIGIMGSASAYAGSAARAMVTKPAAKKQAVQQTGFSSEIKYSGLTDLIEQTEEKERSYFHSLGLSTDYVFNSHFSAGGFVELEYESAGREIVKEEYQSPLGDSGVSFGYSAPLVGNLTLQNTLTEVFPTSELSKTEGYRSIISARSSLPISFESHRLTFINILGFSYIFNTYETSQYYGTANPEATASYTIVPVVRLSKYFSAGASLDFRSTRFLDKVNKFRSSNSVFVGAKWSRFSSKIMYTNGVIPDSAGSPALDSLETMQIDQYRQIVAWELSCAF